MPKIVYLDSFPADNALPILAGRPELTVQRIGRDDAPARAFQVLADAHAYQCIPARDEVPEPFRVDASFLKRAPELLIVSSGGSGHDPFDVEACTAAGVLVVSQAGGNAEAVAEHALGMMLMLLKRVPQADRSLRRGFDGPRTAFRGEELAGRTVGIIGIGHIGRRVAELCRFGFGCRALAYDPYLSQAIVATRHAEKARLEDLLAHADIVTLHCPLTPETRGMIDAAALKLMKPGAVLISTARGSIVDEAALAAALCSGHLGGVGLDVWEREPPPADHPLLQFDNVIVSPHTAGVTREARERMAEMAAQQLIHLFDGGPPFRPVNPDVLPAYAQRFERRFGHRPEVA